MTRRATLALGLLLIAGCASAPDPGASDANPPASGRQQVKASLEPGRPRAVLGGLLSTSLSSLRYTLIEVDPEADERLLLEFGTEDISFELADGTRVGGTLLPYDDGTSEAKPLLIVGFGLLQDRWAGEAWKFWHLYLEDPAERIPAHVVVLDHPTSGVFYAENGTLSVGAYDDGRVWIEVARHLRATLDVSSIHLFGVSMTGQTVVHALIEDQRLGTGLFASGIAASIAPDFQQAPGRQLADLPTREGIANPWLGIAKHRERRDHIVESIGPDGFWMLMEQQFLPSYAMVRPEGLDLDRRDAPILLWNAFQERIAFLRRMRTRNPTWNDEFSLESLGAFMATTRTALVVDRVRTPLVLVSAHDDPAVQYEAFQEVEVAAAANPWVVCHETRRGGHFAFDVAYGKEYMGRIIRLMMDPRVLATWLGGAPAYGSALRSSAMSPTTGSLKRSP